jgi:hypothetical protein
MNFKTTLWLLTGLPLIAAAQPLPLNSYTGGEVGVQISDYSYEEEVDDTFFMSLEGRKVGLVGSYTWAVRNGLYWQFDGRYAVGVNHYKSNRTGELSTNPDEYADGRVYVGRDWDRGSQLLSFYGGLGVRTLKVDSRGYTTTGHLGYRRTSEYLYMPLGLVHRFRIGNAARWSTILEYDHLLQGTQTSYLSDIQGYDSDLKNQQFKGRGTRMSMAYETAQWSLGVFYQVWDVADSERGALVIGNTISVGLEPHNIAKEVGAQLRFRFR